jgi:hypothetical protein
MRQTRLRFNTGAGLIHKFDVARLCDRLLNNREQAFLLRQREDAVSSSALRSLAELYRYLGRLWEAEQMLSMAREFSKEEAGRHGVDHTSMEMVEPTIAHNPKRGRLTLPGLRLPEWERSH